MSRLCGENYAMARYGPQRLGDSGVCVNQNYSGILAADNKRRGNGNMANNQGMSEFSTIAETVADSCIKDMADSMVVPKCILHENLGHGRLRLLCISIASLALAMYMEQQSAKHEAQRVRFFAPDDTDISNLAEERRLHLSNLKGRTLEHPGC